MGREIVKQGVEQERAKIGGSWRDTILRLPMMEDVNVIA
jgi:hypothetical protein